MGFQEDFFQLRTDTSQPLALEQTPIFIGTASKLVTITTINDITNLSTIEPDSGLDFRFIDTEVEMQYWHVVGNYNVTNMNGKILTISTNNEYEQVDLDTKAYTCLILDTALGTIAFSPSLNKTTFSVSGTTKSLYSITIQDDITANLLLPKYVVYIAYLETKLFDSTNFHQIGNSIILNNGIINLIPASNLNTIISRKWNLYYKVMDYRYITLNINDTIPDEYKTNKHNLLGQVYANHKLLSSTKATLFSIPANTITHFQRALFLINQNIDLLGYIIVPLFENPAIASLIGAFVHQQELMSRFIIGISDYKDFAATTLVSNATEGGGVTPPGPDVDCTTDGNGTTLELSIPILDTIPFLKTVTLAAEEVRYYKFKAMAGIIYNIEVLARPSVDSAWTVFYYADHIDPNNWEYVELLSGFTDNLGTCVRGITNPLFVNRCIGMEITNYDMRNAIFDIRVSVQDIRLEVDPDYTGGF